MLSIWVSKTAEKYGKAKTVDDCDDLFHAISVYHRERGGKFQPAFRCIFMEKLHQKTHKGLWYLSSPCCQSFHVLFLFLCLENWLERKKKGKKTVGFGGDGGFYKHFLLVRFLSLIGCMGGGKKICR